MKDKYYLIICLIYLLPFNSKAGNTYSTQDNKIVFKANKKKLDVIPSDRMPMTEKGSWYISKIYPDIVSYPDSLMNIRIFYHYININQLVYQAFKSNLLSKGEFDKAYGAWNVDTTQCINKYVKSFVIVAIANSEKFKYCIIDSDNDLDLNNNKPIRIDTTNSTFLLTNQVAFQGTKDFNIYSDSTWISISINKKRILINFCEYTEGSFFTKYDKV